VGHGPDLKRVVAEIVQVSGLSCLTRCAER